MYFIKFSYRLWLFLLLFIYSTVVVCAGEDSKDTLALVGDRVITTGKFIESYKDKLTKIGLTDNGETRSKYLGNLIRDELLIQDAKNKNLNMTPAAESEYKRIYLQELLNAYSDKYMSPGIIISEEDLKDLFIKLNTKIKVSHLYSASKEEADSIYQLLQNGKGFNELAKELFRDPILKNNGGTLGYISIDEMDPDFEAAAYSMKIGQISKPVKTVQGYSIIKVDDIKQNPFTTESEFLKARERLKTFARKRAYERLTKDFVHNLSKELNIKFNDNLIAKLFDAIQREPLSSLIENPSMISSNDLKSIILTTSEGTWELHTLIDELSIVPPKQQKWIKTKENLTDFIRGIVNRKYISEKAKDEKLDILPSFKEKVNYTFDTYLLTTIEEELKDQILIPPDSIYSYYLTNIELFKSKPEIRLSSILLDKPEVADSVEKMIGSVPFEELAAKYSIQTITAEKGGDIGFYKKEDLDHLGEELFKLKVGEWKGPINDNDKYVFLKCTEYKVPVQIPFEECSAEIEEMLKSFKWFDLREQYVESIKKSFVVRIFPNKLNEIKLK